MRRLYILLWSASWCQQWEETPAVYVGVQKGNHSGLVGQAKRYCSSASQAHVCDLYYMYFIYLFILVILRDWIFLSLSKQCSFFCLAKTEACKLCGRVRHFSSNIVKICRNAQFKTHFIAQLINHLKFYIIWLTKWNFRKLKWPLCLLLHLCQWKANFYDYYYLFNLFVYIYIYILQRMTSYKSVKNLWWRIFFLRGWMVVFVICFGPHNPNEVRMNKC